MYLEAIQVEYIIRQRCNISVIETWDNDPNPDCYKDKD